MNFFLPNAVKKRWCSWKGIKNYLASFNVQVFTPSQYVTIRSVQAPRQLGWKLCALTHAGQLKSPIRPLDWPESGIIEATCGSQEHLPAQGLLCHCGIYVSQEREYAKRYCSGVVSTKEEFELTLFAGGLTLAASVLSLHELVAQLYFHELRTYNWSEIAILWIGALIFGFFWHQRQSANWGTLTAILALDGNVIPEVFGFRAARGQLVCLVANPEMKSWQIRKLQRKYKVPIFPANCFEAAEFYAQEKGQWMN